MISKTKLMEKIDSFPEEFSIDYLIERLNLVEKIEKGKTQSIKNEVISESEFDKEMNQWFA